MSTQPKASTSTELVPVQVRDLPIELARLASNDQREMWIRAAISQGPWKKALEKGGVPAIAGALIQCEKYALDPIGGHMYVAQFGDIWQAFPSAYGLLAIANNTGLYDGAVVVSEKVDGDLAVTRVEAYRKDRKYPAVGDGAKPVKRFKNEHEALRASKTQAMRHALTELFAGMVPSVSSQQAEWEDAEIEAGRVKPLAPPSAIASDPEPDEDQPAASGQLRHLFAIVRDLGWSDEERHEQAGVASFKELTFARASGLIEAWTVLAAARPGFEEMAPKEEPHAADLDGEVIEVEMDLWDREEAPEEVDGGGVVPVEEVSPTPAKGEGADGGEPATGRTSPDDAETILRDAALERLYTAADAALPGAKGQQAKQSRTARDQFIRLRLATLGSGQVDRDTPVDELLHTAPIDVIASLAVELEQAARMQRNGKQS